MILIVAGALLHRLFGLATPVALNLFVLAFVGAGVAILLAGYALWRIWRSGFRGTGNALVAIVIGFGVLMWPISLVPTVQSLPTINDVSTDTISPPAFEAIAKLRQGGANTVTYRGDDKVQSKAYPDLRTLVVQRDAAETVTLVAQALRKLRMKVVREQAPEQRSGVGFVEAVDRTLVLGFYDDVVVRVAGNGRGALVDIRSASRYGEHDLGRNADRVRKVLSALVERIQATIPKKGQRRKLLVKRKKR